ncbi:MAG: oligosaccharide flippase family protein [Lachnospiraceae bacterium]|nr:oligosaccharide flippase family protein [Lachnospiraceae bacterium]
MKSKASIKVNFIYSTIYQVLLLITPLITAPYISRVVGPDGIGNYSFTQSIVVYFSLVAAIGSGVHGQRGVAAKRNDKGELAIFACEIILLRWVTTLISLLLYLVFISTQPEKYTGLYTVQIITIIAAGVDVTWLFQGLENFRITVTTQIIAKLMSVVAIFLFVKSESDILFYVASCTLPTMLGHLLLWPKLRSIIEKNIIKDIHPFRHLKQEILLFIPFIGTLLFSYIDKTMLGYISPSGVENGYYEQALKFIALGTSFVSAISTVVVPRMAFYFNEQDNKHLKFYSIEGTRAIMLVSCLLAGGMFSVAGNIIPWFYGTGYERSILLLQVLSIMMLVKGVNNYFGSAILIPSFKQNKYSVGIWCSAGLNIIINLFLIKTSGAAGACVASVVSEFVLFGFLIYYVRNLVSIGDFLKNSYSYLFSGALSAVIAFNVGKMLDSSIINTLILIFLVILIYCLLLLLFKDAFFISIWRKGIEFIKRKVFHR